MNLSPLPISDTQVSLFLAVCYWLSCSNFIPRACILTTLVKNLLMMPSLLCFKAPFIGVTIGSSVGGMLIIFSILAWAKYKRVLDFVPQLD